MRLGICKEFLFGHRNFAVYTASHTALTNGCRTRDDRFATWRL